MKNPSVFIMGILFFSLLSCATPVVKTDLKSLQENPESYKGKKVIVIADIKSVVETPEPYLNKKIEITGYVKVDGFRWGGDWSFVLHDDNGHEVKCYEREYRVTSWTMPEMALKQAEKEKGRVTVVGKFEKRLKIELDWIEYKDRHFDTDFKPSQILFPSIL